MKKFTFNENILAAIYMLPESERATACYEFCKFRINLQLPKEENLAKLCLDLSMLEEL